MAVCVRKGRAGMEGNDREMIEEIMRHLDAESEHGVYRMSITFDDESDEAKIYPTSAVICTADRRRRRWGFWICTRI